MSRKEQLINSIIQIPGKDNQGSSRTRQHRISTMTRIVHDLFAIRIVPGNWHMLSSENIHALVHFWKKKSLNNATIMNYLVDLRYFLKRINHPLNHIENKDLNLSKPRNTIKPVIDADILLKVISEPIAWLLFALQARFGLTFLESIHVNPAIHIRNNELWITREISTIHKDRLIPVISAEQHVILDKLKIMIPGNNNLCAQFGEQHLRLAWKFTLSTLKLPTHLNYRYVYATTRFTQLCTISSKKEAREIVIRETGITNTSLLWKNLYE